MCPSSSALTILIIAYGLTMAALIAAAPHAIKVWLERKALRQTLDRISVRGRKGEGAQ